MEDLSNNYKDGHAEQIAAMRRRSTFVHDPALDIDPRQLQLAGNVLKIRELKAAREERLTVGFDELPQEVIQNALRRPEY